MRVGFGGRSADGRMPSGRFMGWLVGYWVALLLCYLTLLVAGAALLAVFARSELAQSLIETLPVDDVHAALALEMAGSAGDPRVGVALLHELFQGWWPESFASLAGKTGLVGVLFDRSTSPVAVWAAHAIASGIFIAVGGVILGAAAHLRGPWFRYRRGARRRLVLGALILQGVAVGMQLDLLANDQRAAEIVWPMLATKLSGATQGSGSGPALLLALGMHVTVLVGGMVAGRVIVELMRLPRLWVRRWWMPPRARRQRGSSRSWKVASPAGVVVVLMAGILAASPIGIYADMLQLDLEMSEDSESAVAAPSVPTRSRPTFVDLLQVRGEYWFLVDGRRRVMRGVGYNYPTLDLPPDARRTKLQHDFAQIRKSGFNSILGWSEAEFDQELLTVAAANGLGVVAPFHLDPKWDYTDEAVRRQTMERITAWVERYKSSPALWMWGLGNEVVHGIGDPSKPQAAAFASFLMDAVERIHRLDPNHPIVYRDAEDAYLQPVADALQRRSLGPWFVYGMNFFSYRLGDALEKGPTSRLNAPLLISEFGPAGVSAAGRPDGYAKQWSTIRQHRSKVLGGFVYVWCQKGPEPLDRLFGLTDPEGAPADGTLARLSATFAEEAGATNVSFD